MEEKMQVEVWSDVMCPFCYIGKKKFEIALEQFQHKEKVRLVWKSYQLMPEIESGTAKKLKKMLIEEKGINPDQITAMNAHVMETGKKVGIDFHFDKVYASNTFHAHRFIHFAKQYDKQNEAEEILFHSFFTEGKNVDDKSVIVQLGKEIGLDSEVLQFALENELYIDAVNADLKEAQKIGVQGVPFFIFNKTEAVSGARDSSLFLTVLEETYAEWKKKHHDNKVNLIENSSLSSTSGESLNNEI